MSARNTYLYSPRGKLLVVTPEDRLWLARAVEAEGAPENLVAQTLVNRWANFADYGPGRFPYLTDLVRAYAQPVNPGWFPGGRLLEARVRDLAGKPAELAAELRRAELRPAHAARNTFSAETSEAVRRALFGPVEIPLGAVHYGPQKADWEALTLVRGGPGRNAIYGAGARMPIGNYRLEPVPFDAAVWTPALALDTGSAAAGIAVAALGLATVWRLARAYKGKGR